MKRKEKWTRIPALQLVCLEVSMEGIEWKKGCKNKMIKKKIVTKEKKVLRKDRISIFQVEEDLVVGFVEPVVSRPFKKVNVTRVLYPCVYTLVGMRRFAAEYSQVSRTGVSMYSIRIKL